MEKNYNWWEDPANQEEVNRISWWNHPENKEYAKVPIAIVQADSGNWIASTNDESKFLLGELDGCASGKSKEDAIVQLFQMIQFKYNYSDECRLSYQRWVPFRKGPWKSTGGRWFAIFGIHFSFRYGKKMKGGVYIPFTKLNISIYSYWSVYRKWKLKRAGGVV